MIPAYLYRALAPSATWQTLARLEAKSNPLATSPWVRLKETCDTALLLKHHSVHWACCVIGYRSKYTPLQVGGLLIAKS